MYCFHNGHHRRTGLDILGGQHEFTRLAPKAREPLGGSGGMLSRKMLENWGVKLQENWGGSGGMLSRSLYNAISCVLVWVFMHGASDK